MNKKGRKGNHDLKWSSPFNYQPKSRALATFFSRPALNKKNRKKKKPEKSKAKNTQKPKEETTKRTRSQGKPY